MLVLKTKKIKSANLLEIRIRIPHGRIKIFHGHFPEIFGILYGTFSVLYILKRMQKAFQ